MSFLPFNCQFLRRGFHNNHPWSGNVFALSLSLRDFCWLCVPHLLSFMIPFGVKIYSDVTNGNPSIWISFVLQTFIHVSWSKFLLFPRIDVQGSNSCFSCPRSGVRYVPCVMYLVTEFWSLGLLVLRNVITFSVFRNRDIICISLKNYLILIFSVPI